jgi:hypothetical protein
MPRAEIHVGDNPTLYTLALVDGEVPYDPSTADDVTLIFECPGGTLYERAATVTNDGGSPILYRVEYTTTPDDAETLHGTPGRMRMQVRLDWDDGRKFHSSIEIVDDDGDELRIYPNLPAVTP